ncbi:MAG: antibiotic biosynthesis monooxygenase [Saprospiraceae bacterium]|nr:antibiotic biosynthesis monooxygenase [Saprospiraceae bacterium]
MITRVVKMKFRESEIETFVELFNEVKTAIQSCKGCISVKAVRALNEPQTIFTISYWDSESDLENYRGSELFSATWAKTKALFESKAEAWTLEEI